MDDPRRQALALEVNNLLVDHAQGKRSNLAEVAVKNERAPLYYLADVAFAGNQKAEFAIIDLKKFGIDHPDVDVIVARPVGNDGLYDLRYVNYEEDGIRPLSQHHKGDYDEPFKVGLGDRRLDDVLASYQREGWGAGQNQLSGVSRYGYDKVATVVADRNTWAGFRGKPALEEIYGIPSKGRGARDEWRAYTGGYGNRSRDRELVEHEINRAPGSDRDKSRAYNYDPTNCTHDIPRVEFGRVSGGGSAQYEEGFRLHNSVRRNIGNTALAGLAAQIDEIGRLAKDGPFKGRSWQIEENAGDTGSNGIVVDWDNVTEVSAGHTHDANARNP